MEKVAESNTLYEMVKDKIDQFGKNLPNLNLTEAMPELKAPDLFELDSEASHNFTTEFAEKVIDGILAKTGAGKQPRDGSISLSTVQVIDKFIASKQHSVGETSLRSYETRLKTFGKRYPILPIKPEPIEEYLRSKDGVTAVNHYSTLKMLYEFADERELGVPNVMKKVKKPRIRVKEADYLTQVQAKAYLEEIQDDREKALVYLCLGQGFRINEAVSVVICDIGEELIRIRAGKERDESMPLLPEVRDALLKLTDGRNPNEPVFIGKKGHLSRDMGEIIIKRLFKRAGINNVKQSPHTLRHTFATLAGKAGCDEGWISRLLRHSTKGNRNNVTNRYTHYDMDDLRLQLERYSPLRTLNGSGDAFGKFV